ncbi:MAG: tRNA adenosine(34) deaminase TadA [Desulfofustis sp.]|nr:tRNA adenosine(34) deaminase TadA [Desulfofustis sp.]
MIFTYFDQQRMRHALDAARQAAAQGEVPVGAVLCRGEEMLAVAGNNPIGAIDPTAHAEIRVLREAARQQGNYRLNGTTLYVTLEPCLMCMGALIHSRVERLIFGARDPKTGAACSLYRIGSDGRLNHQIEVEEGLLAEECGALLSDFFAERRLHKLIGKSS